MKKPIYRKWWFYIIIIILLIIIVNQNNNTITTLQELNEETVIAAINNNLKRNISNRTDLSVQITDSTIKVMYTLSNYATDESLVQKVFSDFANFGKIAFSNDDVNKLEFYVRTPLTDNLGNQDNTHVIKLGITKENYNKFNFENLKYHPIYKSFKETCYLFDIHNVLSSIDTDSVYYTSE